MGGEMQHNTLGCQDVVFRAITKQSWLDQGDGSPLADAFLRLAGKERDADGLSVALFDGFPIHADPKELKRHIDGITGLSCVGLLSLLVGHVRELDEVDVVPDSLTHANITGLPFWVDLGALPDGPVDPLLEGGVAEAEHLADMLVEVSRTRWYAKTKLGWCVQMPLTEVV
jgi:hypothetical protein